MTPERAAAVFRELLQTPREELGSFTRRAGLMTRPVHQDLEQAQELLQAIALALQSNPGGDWVRVQAAWTGMRQRHGALPVTTSADPKPPEWVRQLPPEPSLADAAPGTAAYQDQQAKRARFVPPAPPQATAPSPPFLPPPMIPANAAPPPALPPPPPRRPAPPPQVHPLSSHAQPAAAPPVYGESYAVAPGTGAPLGGLAVPASPNSYPQAPHAGAQAHYSPSAPAVQPHPAMPAPSAQAHYSPSAPAVQPHPAMPAPSAQAHYSPSAPAVQPHPAMPAPFAEAAQPSGLSGWTVSKYAAFCAARSVHPDRALATQREYGIADEQGRRQLDDYFAARFDNDACEQEQWERLVAQFRDQLQSRLR
jgi:hypothetical protein